MSIFFSFSHKYSFPLIHQLNRVLNGDFFNSYKAVPELILMRRKEFQ